MKKLTLLLLLGLIFGCVENKNKSLKQENEKLHYKNDSLGILIDSLIQSKPFLFDKAITIEKNDSEASLNIYKQIIKQNETDLWTVYAEERIQELTWSGKQPLKEILKVADTLIFRHHNDKCGEWGGDEEKIKIYLQRDNKKGMNEGELYALYQMYNYDCDELERNPLKNEPKIYYSGQKKLNLQLAKIAEDCIFDLLKHKLNNGTLVSHSGVTNTVELKGSVRFTKAPSIFIGDYPSFSWEKFHLLVKELKK